jgi:hypothetical protein
VSRDAIPLKPTKLRADGKADCSKKVLPEMASAPGIQKGRKREGASTVSLNHPLAANLKEAGEQ